MSTTPSLSSAITNPFAAQSIAHSLQSARTLNPAQTLCVPWHGRNNKGQQVCADSHVTKSPGCDSALDRVHVENGLRPTYANMITISPIGYTGDLYNPTFGTPAFGGHLTSKIGQFTTYNDQVGYTLSEGGYGTLQSYGV